MVTDVVTDAVTDVVTGAGRAREVTRGSEAGSTRVGSAGSVSGRGKVEGAKVEGRWRGGRRKVEGGIE